MIKKNFEYQTIAFFFILLTILGNKAFSQPIIVDHTTVDKYQDIPEYYINEVKKMWFTLPGESHSQAYRTGLLLLESSNPTYAVSVIESGTPEAYTTSNLRASRATWGDFYNATGWIYNYGEEDWFTSESAKSRTKAGITYCNTNNLNIAAIGFGWCWDPGISFNDYIIATDEYVAYCASMDYSTKVVFTTGTVDSYTGEAGYIKYLGYESIRNYVAADPTRILFDYADILCYNDDGSSNTTVWDGHTYPIITTINLGDGSVGHIGSTGALRLGKAIWYMLARIAGWNGLPEGDDTEAPTVPTNLQGTALSITSAQLSWNASTDNVGVTGYNIYRNGTFVSSSTVATFTDNGLSVGNSYSYTVSAFDAADNVSSQSTPVVISINDIWTPSVPTNLQGTALSVTSAQLSWTASTDNVGVTGYRIYRDGSAIGTSATTTFTDNGLTVGNTYSYTVTAFDAAGNESGQSTPVNVNTSDLQAPTVPTNLQGAALSVTSAQLSWTASTDNVGVTGYRIRRDGSAIGTSATTTFTDNGLTVGNTYSYYVTAFDATGNESGQSTPVNVNTSDLQAPTVPTNLQGAALSDTSAQLSWTASTDNVGVTGYRIYRDGSAIGTSATTTFTDNGLTVGNTYSYTVTAFDAAGNESGQSTPVNVNTSDLQAPTVPTNLQGAALSVISAQLSWTASTDNVGVTGYSIYRDGSAIGTIATTTFTDNGLTVGNTYSYTITAFDTAGNESGQSTPVNVNTSDLQAPTVPTNLQGAALSDTSAQLSWTASTDNVGVTGNIIYRDGSAIGTSATTTFTDNGLTVGNTYSYTVTAFDAAGNESGQSTPVNVNTSDLQAPTVPTNLQGAALSDTSAQLSWTASTDNVGVTGNIIYRDGSAIGTSATTTFTDNGLTVGNTYSYTVTAFDAAGNESNHTYTVVVKTSDKQAPTVPKNLQGTAQITTKSAQLTWNPSTDNVGVTGYKIYRNKTVIDSTSTPSYTDNGLIVDNTYIYSVTAYDAADNESNHCQPVLILTITAIPNVFTPNGDGINETWVIPSLDDFPDAVIRIYDRNLKQIIQYTGLDPEWDGRDSNGTALPAGAYLYVIELNKGTRPIKGYVSLIK